MNGTARHALVLLALLALTGSGPLGATTVYRSVDEDGVVTYSDVRPDSGAVETLRIETPPAQPDATQQQRLEDMRETTDRMVADRRAREMHRAELRRLEAASQPVSAANDPGMRYEPEPVYLGVYRGGSGRWHPGYRPHPVHPVAPRPPLRPEVQRPVFDDYPASLIRRHYDPKVRAAFSAPRR